MPSIVLIIFFFFNDTATTEIYTLSLHDALPISVDQVHGGTSRNDSRSALVCSGVVVTCLRLRAARPSRSEEHTSELQSHSDLVCRLLLEKKKILKRLTILKLTPQSHLQIVI